MTLCIEERVAELGSKLKLGKWSRANIPEAKDRSYEQMVRDRKNGVQRNRFVVKTKRHLAPGDYTKMTSYSMDDMTELGAVPVVRDSGQEGLDFEHGFEQRNTSR